MDCNFFVENPSSQIVHGDGTINVRQTIDNHIIVGTSNERRIYKCSHCKIILADYLKYRKHIVNCKKYFCVVCKKTFRIEKNFEKHFKNCPPRKFPCGICGKTYSRKSDTVKHENSHPTPRAIFQCPVCNCVCLTDGSLALHVKQSHPL